MRRLYLAEDQELLNSALKMLLDLEDDFEVVGTSLTGEDVAKQIMDLKVDVALLDIEMPKQSGLEIAKELRQQNYPGKIIILTTFARANYFKEALAQKVDGYLLKDSPSDSLVKAIRAILEGNTVFDPKLVSGVLNEVDNPLTKRELEILKMLEQVATTKELAQRLFLSEGTVRNYISSILSKTGTASRLEALNLARDKGWI
ncbi:response regulator transcription factor [Lactobacillus jensenii]|jgi:two-component response regulator|uniref:Response regulator transcription factor n=1 Tax=Lactobacillus jensenii TaxID=109790 RepID=A0A5N1IHH3_LACJE|nr:response regulator transcription factor [Lactobacillus jensenii]EEQ69122.1 response regulator receiver domain protein [Lactobacillus jensenii 1153]ERJ44256.1 transcriptional regulator [Lactobacillus jensenii MD IIE-70(2)]APT15048.1 DNA-binding response regulator [Lactobacillus jensenii]EEQ25196.1 response regulator receiver domain protein [Lactobacillus jensenii 269-3]EEX26726.1 response regulator receiver domain protein [Lactobacillus jensenii SJ-7A-US]